MINNIKEAYFAFRYSKIHFILNTFIISMLMIVLAFSIMMTILINNKSNMISNDYKGNKLYRIADTLTDDRTFFEFRKSDTNIEKVANFYNRLNEEKSFQVLSIFNQYLFSKENDFKWPHANDSTNSIESIQINEKAFHFYQLTIASGEEPDWQNVSAENDVIPVLLGNDYATLYKIGDKIQVQYYTKNVVLEVKGFLKKNSSIYFNDNPEYYIDSYIIMPYPYVCTKPTNEEDKRFKGILYFAMINTNITSKMDTNNINQRMDEITRETEFKDYLLLGQSDAIKQYDQMINVLQTNNRLYVIVNVIMIILTLLIQITISFIIIQRRKNVYHYYKQLGIQKAKKDMLIVLLIPYVLASILSFFILQAVFSESFNLGFIYSLVFPVISIIYLISVHFVYFLHNKEMEGG